MTTVLVAKGEQDRFLTENPTISFFRTNYRRHVNFSQSLISQVIHGNAKKSAFSTVQFNNRGDMLSYVYLTKKAGGVLQPSITSEDIEKIEFMVGDQVVETFHRKDHHQWWGGSGQTCTSNF